MENQNGFVGVNILVLLSVLGSGDVVVEFFGLGGQTGRER
jgi:hypothetical protein